MSSSVKQIKYAGFWLRAVAATTDIIIFSIICFAVDFLVVSFFNYIGLIELKYLDYTRSGIYVAEVELTVFFINSLIFLLVVPRFLVCKWQATPGKRLFKIFVVDTKCNKLSFKRALYRTSLPVILSIILMAILFQSFSGVGSDWVEVEDKFVVYDDRLKELLPKTNEKMNELGFGDYFFVDNIMNEQELGDFFENEQELLNKQEREEVEELKAKLLSGEYSYLTEESRFNSLYLWLIGIWCFFVAIWYTITAFTKQKTAFHDIIAKTRVIKGRP
jgi:uncharacterized RDD family membrane protein YckC